MSGAGEDAVVLVAQATCFHRFGNPGTDGLSRCCCGLAVPSAQAEAEHHAAIVIAALRSLPVEQRMEAMGMQRWPHSNETWPELWQEG